MADPAREIEHLLYRYAEVIDAGDFDGVTFHRIGGPWFFVPRTMVADLTGDLSQHLLG